MAEKKIRWFLMTNGDCVPDNRIDDIRASADGKYIAVYNKYPDGDPKKPPMKVYCKIVRQLTEDEVYRMA